MRGASYAQTKVEAEIPGPSAVEQNDPSPFNLTKPAFEIPEAGFVSAKVFNVLGQEVTTLVEGEAPTGRQEVTFDAASGLSSGVCYYTVAWAGRRETRQMLLVK